MPSIPPRQYWVVCDSFSGASRFRQYSQLNIFTDGSRLQDRTGTGYVIDEGATEYDFASFSLPPHSTVFQAEVVAILQSVRHILWEACSLRPRYVKIFSDSRSALAALDARCSTCCTVRDAIHALNALAAVCHTVCLIWVPSHSGIRGNERADSLAKADTSVESPYLPLCPLSHSRGLVSQAVRETWANHWTDYAGGRMTKDFLPRPCPGRVRPLLSLDRPTLGRCVAFLTGHNNFRYHLSLREPGTSPSCRFCSLSPETAAHLYADCPRLSTFRFGLGGSFFVPSLPDSCTVEQIVTFLSHPPISAAMDDPHGLPFVIEHDWSDVDPEPPDSDSSLSPPSA